MDSDSDFYGNEETKSDLNARVSSFDPSTTALQDLKLTTPNPTIKRSGSPESKTGHLHNPYEGFRYAWKLDETVDAFLSRVPPSTTRVTADEHWIWICNPFIPRESRSKAANQHGSGYEDEAVLESGAELRIFEQGGMERLHLLSEFISKTRDGARSKTIAAREINQERAQAVSQVLDLAHHLHVRSGKWMLFPHPSYVDDVWTVVARATAASELGVGAKVAPNDGTGSARLICIYTVDFRDKDDIARVLKRMRELELVRANGRPIYYKCDAYTYLGIGSKNAWDIKASLYSSTEIFAYMADKDA
ncbi:hypothetical protein GE09DRAFT_1135874 [Coniochaeta sp. 2T2.1]|nr:hypothetical protein GE09DRAFT_1135874 [Coniochaeta sp. 2T2.1]